MLKEITHLNAIPRGYAAILFIDNPYLGWAIIATTLFFPNIGAAGLISAVTGYGVSRLFRLPDYSNNMYVYNSLLVGLSLGAFYQINGYLLVLILLGAVLTVFVSIVLADALWRYDRLPVLSIPFLLVTTVMALVARHYTLTNDFINLAQSDTYLIHASIDSFFKTLGAVFFVPTAAAGIAIFCGIFAISRYLAALALSGYMFGYFMFQLMDYTPHEQFIAWTGFNFILTAVALGGIYTIPGVAGYLLALLGVLLSTLFIVATQNFLLIDGLPIMALSFVATTVIVLIMLRKRSDLRPPFLAPQPGLPEINFERARLAKIRNGDVNSVPLLTPFFGRWAVYQGFNGPHTHKPPWQYALDFYITDGGRSFSNEGAHLTDYFCYDLPVISPANGDVARIYDNLPDNAPGEVDTKNSWGNFVLIRLDSGLHVLLAHLRQHSVKVKEGDRVKPGTVIAACGNSGRSPQPHIHLQVQRNADLGSGTVAFHLCSVMHRGQGGADEYKVVSIPEEGDTIEATIEDKQLSTQLHLPVGRKLTYSVKNPEQSRETTREMRVELSLLGQFFLVCNTKAKTAFEEINGVLAFYDRSGAKNRFLDMWILAMGLTPLTSSAGSWSDSPSADLLPLNWMQRLWMKTVRPLGCGIKSRYSREWRQDNGYWVQSGVHTLELPGLRIEASTRAIIDTQSGCREIQFRCHDKLWQAHLVETGLIADQGIPGWSDTSLN